MVVAAPSGAWPHGPVAADRVIHLNSRSRSSMKSRRSGHDADMNTDDTPDTPSPVPPDTSEVTQNPDAFRKAHERYGGYLKEGGLPFEPEELADEEDSPPAAPDSASTDGSADQ